MRTHIRWTAVLLTILWAACGGNASSPTSPSVVAPVASGAGNAVVTGNVRLGATAGVGSAADPMKVQVVGTDLVATVSVAGQFALNGVPSGQIALRFFGAGVDATVSIGLVTTGETITISVTVVGTSAVVESEARKSSGQSEEQIEGRVESLPPTQADGAFVVAGRTVTTTATTVFKMGSVTKTFADLELGQRVHVKGSTTAGVFTASLVDIQNVQTDLPVNVNGIVSDLDGSEIDFTFMVNGRKVKGDNATVFFGNGGMNTFLDLVNGVRVEVKGQQQDAAIYAVRIHLNLGDDDASEFEAKGSIVSLTGECPAYTFVLAGRTVTTSASTQFKGADCSDIFNGLTVEVKGTIQADDTVKATRVTIDKDDLEVEVKGTIESPGGTCPSLTFTLGGLTVTTDAFTQFKGVDCGAIADGDQAEVKGTKLADGSVRATRVETEKKDDGGKSAFEGTGTVSELSGTCPALHFTLTVKGLSPTGKKVGIDTDAATTFEGVTCTALINGKTVEVTGTKQASGRVLATKVEK